MEFITWIIVFLLIAAILYVASLGNEKQNKAKHPPNIPKFNDVLKDHITPNEVNEKVKRRVKKAISNADLEKQTQKPVPSKTHDNPPNQSQILLASVVSTASASSCTEAFVSKKILLLGNSGTGKSSLVEALRGKPFNRKISPSKIFSQANFEITFENVDRVKSVVHYALHDGPWKLTDANAPAYSGATGVIALFALDARFSHRDLNDWAQGVTSTISHMISSNNTILSMSRKCRVDVWCRSGPGFVAASLGGPWKQIGRQSEGS